MKKNLLTIALIAAVSSGFAQEGKEDKAEGSSFNRWSIEVAGGVNKPSNPFTPGAFTATPSPWNADLGVRYMLSNNFGLKWDIGYYSFTNSDNSSIEFDTHYYRTSVQGVVNAGNILGFPTWTKRIGLLMHLGGGYSQMKSDDQRYTDRMGHFIVGLTGQVKLSNRIALTGDFTSLTGVGQNRTFDGTNSPELLNDKFRGFGGGIFSGSIGLTFYLGSNDTHADWYLEGDKTKDEVAELQKRIGDLETMLSDADKDGVPDYLDAEPNSTAGMAVDTKGRAIDKNGNGVPDELESYMSKTYGDNVKSSAITNNSMTNNEMIRSLINGGYMCAYFPYNKSVPTNESTEGIGFVLTYLRNNPTAQIEITGHADEIGNTEYNNKLSAARANAVKDVLVKAKIDPARLTVVPAGEDKSVDKSSEGARKLVRRVTFRVK
ncbi:OmpA family protein [Flavobacterium aurantiibacter]|uniref:Flagellar motor protein MotB n=1 Tax=Flavobacterium aurantiibacter TaxID=2023067 RepID=A0A255ZS06_9FLAO|nr:OmpA family protein [Flavobacterium aurantiibacter]OYQ43655.1 flagellar motor protein MotB [Flavobacterium aurantiibacter]